MIRKVKTHKMTLLGSAVALLLAACGGGGDGGSTTGTGTGSGTPTALQGTAATGLAIANASVQAKCATGTGTATTAADGTFTVPLTNATLPCVLQVTTSTGTPLHSVVASGTGTVTVNITPLTELVVAKAATGPAAQLFASFDASAQALVSAQNVTSAIASVTTTLQGVGIELTAADLSGALVAATTTPGTGNALDQKLDALQAKLAAAQTTLAEVANAVANSAPVQTILQPAAATCAGFRSGDYVAINPAETDAEWAAHTFHLDAPTLTATFFDDSTLTLDDDGGCSYTIAETGATTQYLVSKSGLSVGRTTYSAGAFAGKTDVSVIIPKQTLPLAELAGTWNALQYMRGDGGSLEPSRVVMTINAAGQVTSGTECDSAGNCEDVGAFGAFVANSAGGFDFVEGDARSRAFAFKTADGSISLFMVDPADQEILVATKQAALALPTVGAVTGYWDFTIDATGFASPLGGASQTITAIDATAGTYTRMLASNGRIDTFNVNDPGTGLRSREANSCTIGGAVNNCAGIVTMPLVGTGVAVYIGTSSNFFGISINKP